MMGTINCIYETPCGWCSKWDKKCDTRISCQSNGTIGTRRPLPSSDIADTRDEIFNLSHTKRK